VDFTNVVLIMTSNLGSEFIQPDLPDEVVRERVMGVVRAGFRPEFLNRVDDIIVFARLSREEIRRIVDLQLERLAGRLAGRRIALVVSDQARDLIARLGYDPVFGARPLKRVIQRELADRLAMKLLEGEYADGDVVSVDAAGDELVFGKAPLRV
jgi:ATP-dependent Clp protease ATP-binding subunit ClpB